MAKELADGHLLTVQGFGRPHLLNPSRCAQDYVAAYVIDGTVPGDGTECQLDDPPPRNALDVRADSWGRRR